MTRIWAHRGAHDQAPENTPAALERAAELGADGVELDVRTCASGQVVVCHDPHLGRLTGQASWVSLMPWSRLSRIDLGAGQRLIQLDDALDLALGRGLRLNVEVKADVPDRRASARAVAEVLRRRGPAERARVVLSTFDPVVLMSLRRRCSGVPVALLFDEAHTGRWRAALLRAGLRPEGLHPHWELCTAAAVKRWTAAGLFIHAWTVNEPDRVRRLAELGVAGVITDDVPMARAALGRAP